MRTNAFEWLRDEEIVYETGIHKIVFMKLIPVLFILILMSALLSFTNSHLIIIINLILLLLLFLISIPQYMFWKKSFLIVTNQRIIYRIGWIHQNVGEILLKRLIGINVEQDFGGRIFNFGTIKFNGDNDILQPLTQIANPFELKRQVMNQIHFNS